MDIGLTALIGTATLYSCIGLAISASRLVQDGIHFVLFGFRDGARAWRGRIAYAIALCGVMLAWPLLTTGAVAAVPAQARPRSLWHALGMVWTDLRSRLPGGAVSAQQEDMTPMDKQQEAEEALRARQMLQRIGKGLAANPTSIRARVTYAPHVPLEKRLELDRQLRARRDDAPQ